MGLSYRAPMTMVHAPQIDPAQLGDLAAHRDAVLALWAAVFPAP